MEISEKNDLQGLNKENVEKGRTLFIHSFIHSHLLSAGSKECCSRDGGYRRVRFGSCLSEYSYTGWSERHRTFSYYFSAFKGALQRSCSSI